LRKTSEPKSQNFTNTCSWCRKSRRSFSASQPSPSLAQKTRSRRASKGCGPINHTTSLCVLRNSTSPINGNTSEASEAHKCNTQRRLEAPIVAYLKGYLKLESKEEENRVSQRARGYKIIEGNLYKASVTAPLLKCVTTNEGKQILREIHEGICESRNGPRALVGKAFR
jgi:hypothetical protein